MDSNENNEEIMNKTNELKKLMDDFIIIKFYLEKGK